jgi:hypothetical protein
MKKVPLLTYFCRAGIASTLLFSASQGWAESDTRYSVGAKLDFSTWRGDNPNGSSFDTRAPMFTLEAKAQHNNWFGGITLSGGEFRFANTSPSRPNNASPMGNNSATVKRGEADFILGYRFWQRVSLFLDLKNINNEWSSDAYKVSYTGLGWGVSTHQPLSSQWVVYGNFGLVPMNIKANGQQIGDATRSALNVGLLYRLHRGINFNMGLQSQTQVDNYDNGSEQSHRIGALTLGVNIAL